MILHPSQFPKIEIPLDKVLARLGYARGKTRVDAATQEAIDREIQAAARLIASKQVIASSPVKAAAPDRISLEPDLVIKSVKIYELLKDCSEAYGFAVTIGPHLEEKRNAYLQEKETNRALILDAVGSVMAEELAAITHRQIKDLAKAKGMDTTMRFSPGYGDWALSEQKDFLRWLGAGTIGIKLTPSYQMLPEKSVSAIIGITKGRE